MYFRNDWSRSRIRVLARLVTAVTANCIAGLTIGSIAPALADQSMQSRHPSKPRTETALPHIRDGLETPVATITLLPGMKLLFEVHSLKDINREQTMGEATIVPFISKGTPNDTGGYSCSPTSLNVSTSTSGPPPTSANPVYTCGPLIEAESGSGFINGPEEVGIATSAIHVPEPLITFKGSLARLDNPEKRTHFSFKNKRGLRPSIDVSNRSAQHAEEFSNWNVDVWSLLRTASADSQENLQETEGF